MSTPFHALALALLALAASLAFAAPREEVDPEPPGDHRDETAVPSVDPAKMKTDRKLAEQAACNQAVSHKRLQQVGLAVWNYYDVKQTIPDDIKDRNGKPLLSWRVTLLPHLGHEKLYKEFKLDQPWDSPHNKKLLLKMPDAFRSPRVKVRSRGVTVYQVFTGENAVFGRARPLGLAQIPDGTSNTLMAVESSTAVPWTKPGGIPFDRDKALPDFGKAYGKKPLAVMMDGSVRVLDLNRILAETLKNAIDPADGNVLGNDW